MAPSAVAVLTRKKRSPLCWPVWLSVNLLITDFFTTLASTLGWALRLPRVRRRHALILEQHSGNV